MRKKTSLGEAQRFCWSLIKGGSQSSCSEVLPVTRSHWYDFDVIRSPWGIPNFDLNTGLPSSRYEFTFSQVQNKFCQFAKALVHYFSNIKKYRESKERKVNFRSSVYGASRALRWWPLNFFLVIDKGKDDTFTPTVDGIIVVLIIIIAFSSAVLIFIAVTVL